MKHHMTIELADGRTYRSGVLSGRAPTAFPVLDAGGSYWFPAEEPHHWTWIGPELMATAVVFVEEIEEVGDG